MSEMEIQSMDESYGCLYCWSGREEGVIGQIATKFPEVHAIVPAKLRYRRHGGQADEERVKLFPGYVFFRTTAEIDLVGFSRIVDLVRVLTYADGDWRLHGADSEIAREIFDAEGTVGFSTAYYEGDRIRIVDGFLKKYEGSIIRVNRRAKTAEIRVCLQDKVITTWLGFELIDKGELGNNQ